MTRFSRGQFVRFVVVGVLNSGITYVGYLCLLGIMSYAAAYSVAYGAGILLSFVGNSRFVFRVPLRWHGLVQYPVVYLVQYLVGLTVIYVGVEVLGWDQRLLPIVALAVTVPVTFVLTRSVLAGRPTGVDSSGA